MINIFITNLLQFGILEFIAYKVFEPRINIKYHIVGIILGARLLFIFNMYGPSQYGAFASLVISFFMALLFFKASIIDSALLSILQLLNAVVAEFIAMYLFNLAFQMNGNTDINSFLYTCALGLSFVITLLLSFVTIKLFIFKKRNVNFKYSGLIFVLPIVTMILALNISDSFVMVEKYPIVLFVIIGLLVSVQITLFLFLKNLTSFQLELDLKKKQEEIRTTKEMIQLLNEQYKNNFDYLHELLHKIQIIKEKAPCEIDSLEELSKDIDLHFNSILTNSLALNAVINRCITEIERNKIVIRNTVFDSLLFLEFDKQIELYSYLLNIGIEACNKIPTEERLILFQIKKEGDIQILKFNIPNNNLNIEEIKKGIQDIIKIDYYFNYNSDSRTNTVSLILIFQSNIAQSNLGIE